MPLSISSLQNPRIKQVVRLQNRRARDKQQRMVVEGIREFTLALDSGFRPETVFICPDVWSTPAEKETAAALRNRLTAEQTVEVIVVSPPLFAKMAYRGQSGGFLGLFPYLDRSLDDLPLSPAPFLVIIEGGEKPGNIGAILRTAAAAGVDGLILCSSAERPGTDMHNPNVVRASLGTVFAVPFAMAETAEVISWLRRRGIPIAAATPDGERRYTAVDLTGGIAIIMGSEAFGLSDAWLQAADKQMVIPMSGKVDSLNLSVATALLIYEVVRQRYLHSAPPASGRTQR